MKRTLLAILIISTLSGLGSAESSSSAGYSFDGNGVAEYPNEGVLWAAASASDGNSAQIWTEYYETSGHTMNFYMYSNVDAYRAGWITRAHTTWKNNPSGSWNIVCDAYPSNNGDYESKICTSLMNTAVDRLWGTYTTTGAPGDYANSYIRVTVTSKNVYNVSGNTSCISSVKLNYSDNQIDIDTNLSAANDYSFRHLIDGETYKLIFSDAHEYEFTVSGSDVIYDYDACSHSTYRLEESCGNLIPDSEGFYIEKLGGAVLAANNFYVPNGILDIINSSANNIYVNTNTFIGSTGWVVDPVVTDTTYILENPYIAWGLKVIVQNESDGSLIDGAMVRVLQDCYCANEYSTRQKMTVNGMVEFGDMSLQDASLFVMASGYKICNENTTGYDVFLSGRTNFSSKTWVVKLAPSESENVSTFYEVNNKVDIHFKDVNMNRTAKILDTDSEVYLYYENNNTDNEAMTLKFQSSSTHSYFSDELSWTISHDDIGHKTIANSYFTPWDYSYRAVIYNASIYGWNITIPLTVRNATKEETLHYENLTTHLYFLRASDGKIDYREDLDVGVHACSNNTTLMHVDIELYKNNSLLCYKNMTAPDFTGASFPYWYVWSPIFDYEAGANYSIRMFGFDRTLLETDYLECVADDITRKNKLTIVVKNRFGTNLNNAFVYLEGYGSLPTGVNSYAAFEGIGDGYYRYKATKAGYDAAGWDDITMSNGDAVVVYTLTETASATGSANAPKKVDDDELKNLYIMMLSLLLIVILFGGFIYVTK